MTTPRSEPDGPPRAPRTALEALRLLLPAHAFSGTELEELTALCELRAYPAEQVLIREGEPPDNLVYFLLDGQVSVTIQGRHILSLHNQGDTIGEMGLISAAPRSATVRTDVPSSFLIVDATLATDPMAGGNYKLRYYLGRIFNSILTEKLRTTSDRARLYEDMADRSRAAEQQQRSLEEEIGKYLQQISLYSHLVNSANDAIFITDTEGRVLQANPALTRTFGIDTADVIGTEIGTLLSMPDGRPGDWADISRAAGAEGWKGEALLLHPPLRPIPVDCSVSMVRDDGQRGDELLAYSVFLRDTRVRKALEAKTRRQAEELEQAYAKLSDLDRIKSQFLSMVSHELRTPIANILSYSELLGMEGMVEPEDQGEFVRIIHEEAQKLGEMVHKVLAISKLASGEMLFNFAPCDLGELVREVGAMQRPRAEGKGLTLELDIQHGLAPVEVDAENLREALVQLVDNAVHYTEQGRIVATVRQDDSETLLQISDTGMGIGGKDLAALLETFGRGESANIGGHGLGLGLPLCYLIVTAHSGSLRLEPGDPQGTVAAIVLPRRTAGQDAG